MRPQPVVFERIARRFRDPPLDYPSDEMEPSGLYSHGRLLSLPVTIADWAATEASPMVQHSAAPAIRRR